MFSDACLLDSIYKHFVCELLIECSQFDFEKRQFAQDFIDFPTNLRHQSKLSINFDIFQLDDFPLFFANWERVNLENSLLNSFRNCKSEDGSTEFEQWNYNVDYGLWKIEINKWQ